ncbi:MAG: ferredoxin family protein [Promethearchaeota archaeon]|nr:MAG: ferredoxin family protein [Candidatus Lokiarchaeota archaeon]
MKIDVKGLSKHIPGTGDFISIDPSKCNGCGRCTVVCIMNLWLMRDGVARLVENYQEKCVECAGCYSVCEPNAINFRYPKGGTGVVFEQG